CCRSPVATQGKPPATREARSRERHAHRFATVRRSRGGEALAAWARGPGADANPHAWDGVLRPLPYLPAAVAGRESRPGRRRARTHRVAPAGGEPRRRPRPCALSGRASEPLVEHRVDHLVAGDPVGDGHGDELVSKSATATPIPRQNVPDSTLA